jgi:hypothetical protein
VATAGMPEQEYISQSVRAVPAAPAFLETLGFWEKLPFAITCGAVLGLCAAGTGMFFLAWVSLAPLVVLTFGCRSKWQAMFTGFAYGLCYHLVALRWLAAAYPRLQAGSWDWVAGLGCAHAWVVEAAGRSCLFALFALFLFALPMRAGYLPHRRRPFFPALVTIPLIWVFLQWVVAFVPIFGPVVDCLAYSQAPAVEVIQVARFAGAQGVEFLLALVNCAVALFVIELTGVSRRLSERTDRLSARTGATVDLVGVVVLVALVVGWGRGQVLLAARLPQPFLLSGLNAPATGAPGGTIDLVPPVPVAVLQGGNEQGGGAGSAAARTGAQWLELSRNSGASLLIVSEGLRLGTAPGGEGPFVGQLDFERLACQGMQEILVGAPDALAGSSSASSKSTSIFLTGPGGTVDARPCPGRGMVQLPVADFLDAWMPGSSLVFRGMGAALLHLDGAAPVLVKSAYGEIGVSRSLAMFDQSLAASQASKGASLFVNFADFNSTGGPLLAQQVLYAAAFRAVENGRYVIVASSTGPAAVIDPCGVVTSTSSAFVNGVLLDRVQFLWRRTLFTRMWWVWTPLVK